MSNAKKPVIWKVGFKGREDSWHGELVAYWEVDGDPISDDCTPSEISAEDLLLQWATIARKNYPSGLIPIHWFVDSPGMGEFQAMPFQYNHFEGMEFRQEDFLMCYDWPLNPANGERINWFSLPVVDKFWNHERADKGGFLQEATGWKPGILQPFVYMPSLLKSNGGN